MVANKIPFQLNLDRRDKEVEKARASQLKFATLLILFCSLQCVSIILPCSKLIKPHIAVN